MTPQDLIAAFDTLAEAPDGVKRLRELVLQLAVRGKLVPQDPEDEPATVLLERIAAEKTRLVREKVIRKPRAIPSTDPSDHLFDLPPGWSWTRLAQLVPWDLTDGDWVESKDQDPSGRVRLTQLADVGVDAFLDKSSRFLTPETASRLNCTYLEPHDVLIARLPRPLGRACVFPGLPQPAVTVVDVAIVRCGDCGYNRFIVHLMNSVLLHRQVEALAAGTTRKRISTGNLRKLLVPVPPLAEQHRIVARVDELMGLLDRLEAARTARDTTRAAARDAALAALREADTPEEVEVAWDRFAERMDDLVREPDDIEPVRQAVLQLAVRGKLVRQDPGDEPAGVLLERIAAEKARLVKEKVIRKPKCIPLNSSDPVPFVQPESWRWVRLGEVLRHCQNGTSVRPNTFGAGFPLLRISAGTSRSDGVVELADHRFGDLPDEKAKRHFIEPDDLLACRFNGNLHFVGKVAQVPASFDGNVLHPDKLICLRAIETSHGYLRVAINSEATREQVREAAATTAGNIGINGKQVQSLVVPIPPLAEQLRIVARVDELMGLLGRLEARLTTVQAAHSAFASAAVHHLDA